MDENRDNQGLQQQQPNDGQRQQPGQQNQQGENRQPPQQQQNPQQAQPGQQNLQADRRREDGEGLEGARDDQLGGADEDDGRTPNER